MAMAMETEPADKVEVDGEDEARKPTVDKSTSRRGRVRAARKQAVESDREEAPETRRDGRTKDSGSNTGLVGVLERLATAQEEMVVLTRKQAEEMEITRRGQDEVAAAIVEGAEAVRYEISLIWQHVGQGAARERRRVAGVDASVQTNGERQTGDQEVTEAGDMKEAMDRDSMETAADGEETKADGVQDGKETEAFMDDDETLATLA